MRIHALALTALLACAAAHADAPALSIDNEAGVPPKELASIERDFRAWATRVYAYHQVTPGPVTVRITKSVPFGFYGYGTVLLPPSKDRWEMLDNFVHELTHHATGRNSSFFFKEGAAVHTLEALFAQEGRVPDTWPQFGQSTDAWVALYGARGQLLPIYDALTWPRYRGGTPDDDFRSWQIYNQAGSFTGWYLKRHGLEAWRDAFKREWPAQDSAELEKAWLADIAARKPASFDPAKVLPAKSPRYRAYAARLSSP